MTGHSSFTVGHHQYHINLKCHAVRPFRCRETIESGCLLDMSTVLEREVLHDDFNIVITTNMQYIIHIYIQLYKYIP